MPREGGSRAVGCYAYDLSRQRVSDGYVVHDDYAVFAGVFIIGTRSEGFGSRHVVRCGFAVTFFVSGLLGPVWGVLADRKSRKLMALRASIGLTISYALCGIVQTPMQLFAARFFQGLCAGLYPALLALLAASIPARKTGLSMGLMQEA